MSQNSQPSPKAGSVQVHIPANLEPTYANFALITHSRSEIVIDFAQVLPQVRQARVKSRVVLTALNAKLLLRALGENISRFEQQHGEISLPEGSSLADQLFRSTSPEDSPEE
jgi:hypothetical protein